MFGSEAKCSTPVMYSYAPAVPNHRPLASGPRCSISIRVTGTDHSGQTHYDDNGVVLLFGRAAILPRRYLTTAEPLRLLPPVLPL
jgi:hypothetical protein